MWTAVLILLVVRTCSGAAHQPKNWQKPRSHEYNTDVGKMRRTVSAKDGGFGLMNAVGQVRPSHCIYFQLGPTSLTDLHTLTSIPIPPTSVLAFQRSLILATTRRANSCEPVKLEWPLEPACSFSISSFQRYCRPRCMRTAKRLYECTRRTDINVSNVGFWMFDEFNNATLAISTC